MSVSNFGYHCLHCDLGGWGETALDLCIAYKKTIATPSILCGLYIIHMFEVESK